SRVAEVVDVEHDRGDGPRRLVDLDDHERRGREGRSVSLVNWPLPGVLPGTVNVTSSVHPARNPARSPLANMAYSSRRRSSFGWLIGCSLLAVVRIVRLRPFA